MRRRVRISSAEFPSAALAGSVFEYSSSYSAAFGLRSRGDGIIGGGLALVIRDEPVRPPGRRRSAPAPGVGG